MTKVVSIKAHPKYRDHASLRQYLAGGQDEFGTKVGLDAFYDLDNPEVQHQLKELNLWCEVMKEIGPGVLPKPQLVDLSDIIELPINNPGNAFEDAVMLHYVGPPPIDMDPHLVKNLHPLLGDNYSFYTGSNSGKSLSTGKMLSAMFPNGLRKGDFYDIRAVPMPWDSPTPLHHMSRNSPWNIVKVDNSYKVKGRDDANPDA